MYFYMLLLQLLPHTAKQSRKYTPIVSAFHYAQWACIGTATVPSLITFQNKITVTKLLMKSSLAIICHKAKLGSIFATNFLSREANSSLALPAFWR